MLRMTAASGSQYSAPRYYEIAFDTDQWREVNFRRDPSGRTGITASWILREAILTWWAT
jgi:hypothetical protein